MKRGLTLCLIIVCIILNTAGPWLSESFAKDKKSASQSSQSLNTQVDVQLDYLLYLPEDYDQKDAWPVLLFLHGAGERGDDLNKVKVHGPPKLIEQGKEFPFIVVSPQCPSGYWWESIELVALLNEINSKYNVDEDRVYVTGLSMGGFGSWRLANYAPERIAAIAPVCGGGEPYWTKRFANLPVWAFHGAKDTVIPPQRSLIMIDALMKNKADPKPKLTIYPEAKHDSWTQTYNNPELYKWLLKQNRRDKVEIKTKK